MTEPDLKVEQERIEKIEAMFEAPTLRRRLRALVTGLRQPRGSAAYKEAFVELQRLLAPVLAVLLPAIFIAILFVCTIPSAQNKMLRDIQIVEAQEDDTLDEAPVDLPDDLDMDQPADMDLTMDVVVTPDVSTPLPEVAPTAAAAPVVNTVDAVMNIKAPVMLKSVFGDTRSAAARATSLRHFGGNAQTEAAVMRALRWLKTKQRPDGSWPGQAGADNMRPTGLAILTFLSHGEKPGSLAKEFGGTIQKGVEYLMRTPNLDAAEIHALSEAFGMARNPNIRPVVEARLNALADRLANTEWGPPHDNSKAVLPRLLPMTFETMALRSAKLSRLNVKNMEKALMKLKEGFLHQANTRLGGFSDDHWGPPGPNYRRTGLWHYMVGVVAMQYLGASRHPVIEKTLAILDDEWEPPTLDTTDIACCPVRGNYWATMVFFNAGGKRWANWNREMVRTYLAGQHRLANTPYKDPKGRPQELGYWTCEDMHISHDTTGMEIITTCYVAQQLMVYYRYLPTSSREAWNAEEEKPATPVETGDVSVDFGDL